ncbi:uncharacterized protein [Engystomops pustulosus]|uniref:uncharacterized protein n=1 Tax=Engystomops pustulosus TaxID=76066 RepID=UPI003AFA7540
MSRPIDRRMLPRDPVVSRMRLSAHFSVGVRMFSRDLVISRMRTPPLDGHYRKRHAKYTELKTFLYFVTSSCENESGSSSAQHKTKQDKKTLRRMDNTLNGAKLRMKKREVKEVKEPSALHPCPLSEDQRRQAEEAKEQTLQLLSDALKKKKSLLVEDPEEFKATMKDHELTCITTDLVKEMIHELEKVTCAKNTNPEDDETANAYVYPGSGDRTIYLCAPFWKMDLTSKSQQKKMIHEVSHFLGYGHTLEENSDRVRESPQSMLCPLTSYSVASAIILDMNHGGSYRDGSYSCCGETSRDTVCEESCMAYRLRLRFVIHRMWRLISPVQSDPVTSCEDGDISEEDAGPESYYYSGKETDTSGEETDSAFEDLCASDEEIVTALRPTHSSTLGNEDKDLLETQINNSLKMETNQLKINRNTKSDKSLVSNRNQGVFLGSEVNSFSSVYG